MKFIVTGFFTIISSKFVGSSIVTPRLDDTQKAFSSRKMKEEKMKLTGCLPTEKTRNC